MTRNPKETKPETRRLPCALTEPEQKDRAKHLTQEMDRHDRVDAQRAAAASTFKGQLKEIETRIRDLRNAVATGTEPRDVECTWEKDYAEGTLTLRRNDTGEVVVQHPLPWAERQQSIQELLATVGETAPEARDDAALRDALLVVERDVPLDVVESWSNEQADAAFAWATAVHARASDNDVELPEEPEHVRGAVASEEKPAAKPKKKPRRN